MKSIVIDYDMESFRRKPYDAKLTKIYEELINLSKIGSPISLSVKDHDSIDVDTALKLKQINNFMQDLLDEELFDDKKERLKLFSSLIGLLRELIYLSKEKQNKYLYHGTIVIYDAIKYSKIEDLSYELVLNLLSSINLLKFDMNRSDVVVIARNVNNIGLDWLPWGDENV